MGKIITVEGCDCSFKSTNAERLYNTMKDNGLNVRFVHFPRYESEASYFVRQFLNGKYPNLDPRTIGSLYTLDRMDFWADKENQEFYQSPDTYFIFDRYVISNGIYQGARFNIGSVTNMFDIVSNEYKSNIPREDLCIFMRSSTEFLKYILEDKENKDYNESDFEYIFKVNDMIIKFIKSERFTDIFGNKFYPIEIINSTVDNKFKDRDQLFAEVLNTVNAKFNLDLKERK